MADWTIRVRGVVATYFAVVVAVLVVLALASGFAAYSTYANPGTHTEERQGPSWETTANFDHSATVSEPNRVYYVGTTLENRSAYFSAISPVLDGAFTYGYTASESGALVVDTESELVLRSVKRDRNDEIETRYWQMSRDLADPDATHLAPGESVTAPFSFNASALTNQSTKISEELGGSVGTTEAFVRVTVDVSGTVNGDAVDRTEVYTLPVGVGDVYTVSNPGTVTEAHTATEQVVVPNDPDPLTGVGSSSLFVLSLAALGLVVSKKRDGTLEPTTTEREYLTYREARTEFDEWINRIELPSSAFDLPMAHAASLGDLVDFAIDTNNSVLEDPNDGTYYVIHGDYLYYYDPPTEDPDVDAHDGSADGTTQSAAADSGVLPRSLSDLLDGPDPTSETASARGSPPSGEDVNE
ncbi:DUF5305 domain-containing protein [Haloferax sp. YSSS75]|uniref:DUF5305 domain-containing protein n=1 Tax=Haloferax sp. YSSS75 TaxID=3388564 RepID=UPI00398D3B91